MSEEEDNYTTIRIPKELDAEIKQLIGKKGFRSKAEIVKQALRNLLDHYHEMEMRVLPRFEQINCDDKGVKILDRQISRVADIHFRPDGVWCEVDEKDSCQHIDYALSLPDVQRIIKKHIKEGWKLPDI